MAEPAKEDQTERARKPNCVEIWNAGVLTITMIAVIAYACVASNQNKNLVKSVAEETAINRPVVLADGISPISRDAEKNLWTFPNVPTDMAHVFVVNFGKTVANEVAVFGSLAKAPENAAPFDSRCDSRPDAEPPKSAIKTPLAPVNETIVGNVPNSYQQNWTFNGDNSGSSLYAVGCVYYKGLDGERYYTDMCTVWRDSSFMSCNDAARNFVR
jgi:hypothetical protein